MTIVDTGVWVDYFNGYPTPQTDWLDHHVDDQPVGLLDLILCEVLQGFHRQTEFEDAKSVMLQLPVLPTCGTPLALASAANYSSLRRRGVTIRKTVDCLIATACILEGHTLLHNDRDFDAFERYFGLEIIKP